MKPIVAILLYLVLGIDFYLIFVVAPEEATQGLVQKIFYFHVSSAFAMYFGFLISALGAFLYLWKRKPHYNCLAEAGASVGLVFCSMVLGSGPIWAKPIWGTYWTWDPRLTTTFLIFLVFLSTLFLRKTYGADPKGKVFANILTLFGVLDIPLIFFAVKLWRGIHPSVLGGENNMPTEMKITLIVTNITVIFLFSVLLYLKYQLLLIQDRLKEIKG